MMAELALLVKREEVGEVGEVEFVDHLEEEVANDSASLLLSFLSASGWLKADTSMGFGSLSYILQDSQLIFPSPLSSNGTKHCAIV